MPTKIILKQTLIPSKVHATSSSSAANHAPVPHRNHDSKQQSRGLRNNSSIDYETDMENQKQLLRQTPIDADDHHINLRTPPRSNLSSMNSPAQLRSVISFRSSIIREMGKDNDDDNIPAATKKKHQQQLTTSNTTSSVNQSRQEQQLPPKVRLSKDDIRASPRITGYLFTLIAASVLLTSVVQFYKRNIDVNNFKVEGGKTFFVTGNTALVYRWKVYGAIYLSATGVGLSFMTLLVHFDTILLPKLWFYIFRDGSIYELYYITFLLIFWAVSIHVNTSSLSIGELQANAFFTTWISFASIISTLEVWRESAGYLSISSVGLRRLHQHSNDPNQQTAKVDSLRSSLSQQQVQPQTSSTSNTSQPIPDTITTTTPISSSKSENINDGHTRDEAVISPLQQARMATTSIGGGNEKVRRETTSNWIWTAVFSFIFAGSATDIYHNRAYLRLRYQNQEISELSKQNWVMILSVVWAEAFICFLAIICNETLPNTGLLPCYFHRRDNKLYRFVFGWRQIEGIVLLFTGGLKFWIILKYTGVAGVANGLSNAYFGVWGSFFNSIFTFGTWIRENKNIEYVVEAKPSDSLSSRS